MVKQTDCSNHLQLPSKQLDGVFHVDLEMLSPILDAARIQQNPLHKLTAGLLQTSPYPPI
jgi:hypothetical protein